jgi:hypothetical protein
VRKHRFAGLRVATATAALLGLFAVSVGPVAADTTPPPGGTYSQNGSSADVYASSCVDNGDDTVTCLEQQIGIFSGKMTDTVAGVTHSSQLCAAISSYTFSLITKEYVGTPTFERGCRADLPSGTIRFDSKLAWATLAATHLTVEQLVCDKEACIPGASRDVVVAATWTGIGPLRISKSRSSGDDGTCRYNASFRGSDRSADIVASFDGQPVGGDVFGSLASGRFSFRSNCTEF